MQAGGLLCVCACVRACVRACACACACAWLCAWGVCVCGWGGGGRGLAARRTAGAGLSPPAACPSWLLLLPLCRAALTSGASPELAAALQGVSHAKLFLGGEVVRTGQPAQEMLELAAAAGMSVVLPSGAGLGLVGGAAPAVQLL